MCLREASWVTGMCVPSAFQWRHSITAVPSSRRMSRCCRWHCPASVCLSGGYHVVAQCAVFSVTNEGRHFSICFLARFLIAAFNILVKIVYIQASGQIVPREKKKKSSKRLIVKTNRSAFPFHPPQIITWSSLQYSSRTYFCISK